MLGAQQAAEWDGWESIWWSGRGSSAATKSFLRLMWDLFFISERSWAINKVRAVRRTMKNWRLERGRFRRKISIFFQCSVNNCMQLREFFCYDWDEFASWGSTWAILDSLALNECDCHAQAIVQIAIVMLSKQYKIKKLKDKVLLSHNKQPTSCRSC